MMPSSGIQAPPPTPRRFDVGEIEAKPRELNEPKQATRRRTIQRCYSSPYTRADGVRPMTPMRPKIPAMASPPQRSSALCTHSSQGQPCSASGSARSGVSSQSTAIPSARSGNGVASPASGRSLMSCTPRQQSARSLKAPMSSPKLSARRTIAATPPSIQRCDDISAGSRQSLVSLVASPVRAREAPTIGKITRHRGTSQVSRHVSSVASRSARATIASTTRNAGQKVQARSDATTAAVPRSQASCLPKRLAEAAQSGDTEVARRCLASGVTPAAQDDHGWTALHYAAAEGHLEMCKLLFDFASNEGGCVMRLVEATLPDLSTPLMLATEEAHLEVARLLLSHGARPTCKDEVGFTALDRCASVIHEKFSCLVQECM